MTKYQLRIIISTLLPYLNIFFSILEITSDKIAGEWFGP